MVPEIEAARRVRIELGPESAGSPTPLDPALAAALARAAEAVGVPYRAMPSGGGHGASAFAQAGIPAAMLFMRNQNGNHLPDEAMGLEDFATACRVLERWLVDLTA